MKTQGKPNLARGDDGTQALSREEQVEYDKKVLYNFLRKNEKTMIQAWKGSIDPRDLNMIVMGAVAENPRLLQCSARSIIRAMVTAARCKIKPGGHMGRGYLVPRRNKNTGQQECCFDPGYRGMRDLATRTGEIIKITAHAVKKDDYFKYDAANDEVEHVPDPDKQGDDVPVKCAYAKAKFKSGEIQVEVVWKPDLDKIRNASMAKAEGTPWGQWYEEMARKSAMRRICKWLPTDDALEVGLAASDNADGFGVEVFHSAEQEEELEQITQTPLGKAALPPRQESPPEMKQEPTQPRTTTVADTRSEKDRRIHALEQEKSNLQDTINRVKGPSPNVEPEPTKAPPPPPQEPAPEPTKAAPPPQEPAPEPTKNRRRSPSAVKGDDKPPPRRRKGSTSSQGKPSVSTAAQAPVETTPEPPMDTPFDGEFDEDEPADEPTAREMGDDSQEQLLS